MRVIVGSDRWLILALLNDTRLSWSSLYLDIDICLLLEANIPRFLVIGGCQLGLLFVNDDLVLFYPSIAAWAESAAEEAGYGEEDQEAHEDEKANPPAIVVEILVARYKADFASVIGAFGIINNDGNWVWDGITRELEAEIVGGEDEETSLLAKVLLIHLDIHLQGLSFSLETFKSEVDYHAIFSAVKLGSFEIYQR